MRTSQSGYRSDFHVAGDPTLLIILAGAIELTLPDGDARVFAQGDMFVAEDYLKPGIEFIHGKHGHKAVVVGEQRLLAIHLKLEHR